MTVEQVVWHWTDLHSGCADFVTPPAQRLPTTVRALRGVVLGGVIAGLGVSAHVLGGGELPDTALTFVVAGLAS